MARSIGNSASTVREQHRARDGRFGTQPADEADDVDLATSGEVRDESMDYYLPAALGTRQTQEPLAEFSLDTRNGEALGLAREVSDGALDMNPSYQRGSVWTTDQRIGLVKSWCQAIPVPPVTLNDRTTPKWAQANADQPSPRDTGRAFLGVVDGKQRLETARAWYASEFGVPASWFPDDEVEETFETPDGPYVRFNGLSTQGQRFFSRRAKLPVTTATLATERDEAGLFLLLNGGGTAQTEESMENAARVAGGANR